MKLLFFHLRCNSEARSQRIWRTKEICLFMKQSDSFYCLFPNHDRIICQKGRCSSKLFFLLSQYKCGHTPKAKSNKWFRLRSCFCEREKKSNMFFILTRNHSIQVQLKQFYHSLLPSEPFPCKPIINIPQRPGLAYHTLAALPFPKDWWEEVIHPWGISTLVSASSTLCEWETGLYTQFFFHFWNQSNTRDHGGLIAAEKAHKHFKCSQLLSFQATNGKIHLRYLNSSD